MNAFVKMGCSLLGAVLLRPPAMAIAFDATAVSEVLPAAWYAKTTMAFTDARPKKSQKPRVFLAKPKRLRKPMPPDSKRHWLINPTPERMAVLIPADFTGHVAAQMILHDAPA